MRRAGLSRLAPVACALVLATAAQAEFDWQRRAWEPEAARCIAVFEVRESLLIRWHANRDAILHERAAGVRMAALIAENGTGWHSCTGANAPAAGIGAYCRGPYDISWLVTEVRPEIAGLYAEMGLDGAFPLTCMEDAACTTCRDLLRAMEAE